MFKSAEIAKLQEQIEALTKSGAAAGVELAAKVKELETALAEVTGLTAKVKELETQISTMVPKADLEALTTKLEGSVTKADFDKKVEDTVLDRCAAAGVAPIKRDPAGTEGGASTYEEAIAEARKIEDPSLRAKAIQKIFDTQK